MREANQVAFGALEAVSLIREQYASGPKSMELTREVVEMLKSAAAARAGGNTGDAAILFGVAEAIEGAYLGMEINQRLHQYIEKRAREEQAGS